MMEYKALDNVRWAAMDFIGQMANIGSEIGRTYKWVSKGKKGLAESAFLRALDLIDLTLKYGRLNTDGRGTMLKELCRLRECFCGAYLESDTNTLSYLDRYMMDFAVAQRKKTDLGKN